MLCDVNVATEMLGNRTNAQTYGQVASRHICMMSAAICRFRYSFKSGSRSFVSFESKPVSSSNVAASSLNL
jgi:hypothetical protein